MKKLLLSSLFLSGAVGFGQTIFHENFESSSTLPAGWAQYNVDGKNPASSVNFMGSNAWIVRAISALGTKVAVSTSWYSPTGKSNDWLATPQIILPAGGNYVLKYDVMAPDPSYPDDYEVWISTEGNAVADFLAGTKLLSETGNPEEMKTKYLDLSSYAGDSIYIAFRNVANDKYLLYIDNVEVSVLNNDDVKLEKASHNRLSLVNTNNTITYTVFNKGGNTVTSLKVKYSDGTTDVEEDVNVTINSFQSATVNLPTPLNYSTILEKVISHEILKVNTNDDSDPSDNTVPDTKFNTISESYTRKVVIEEGTGTWCGWCPRGAVAMDYMHSTYPDRFIGIAVHNDDPMTVSAYDNGADFSGYPSCNVDRVILDETVGQTYFVDYYNQRKDVATLAKVEGIVTSSGTSVTIEAKAKFNTIIANANLRLGVVMIEDNVTGTASGYNQTNYYSGGEYGPMGGYELLTDPVAASLMVYNHVGRALLGGYNGQSGSVPSSITETTEATYTFNYTIPSAFEKNNMYAVILLIDNETGEIYNAEKYPLAVLSTDYAENVNRLEVYPNPANKVLNISLETEAADYTVAVYDMTGKLLVQKSVKENSNVQFTTIDISALSKGNYLVSVATKEASYTKHFVVE